MDTPTAAANDDSANVANDEAANVAKPLKLKVLVDWLARRDGESSSQPANEAEGAANEAASDDSDWGDEGQDLGVEEQEEDELELMLDEEAALQGIALQVLSATVDGVSGTTVAQPSEVVPMVRTSRTREQRDAEERLYDQLRRRHMQRRGAKTFRSWVLCVFGCADPAVTGCGHCLEDARSCGWICKGGYLFSLKKASPKDILRALAGVLIWAVIAILAVYGFKGGKWLWTHIDITFVHGSLTIGWVAPENTTTIDNALTNSTMKLLA